MRVTAQSSWIVVSGWMIREGRIIHRSGDLVLFRFREGGGIRIPAHRIYPSLQEAQASVRKERHIRGVPAGGRFQGNAWLPD